MDEYLIQGETLTEIANAIRTVTGTTESINTEDMPEKILSHDMTMKIVGEYGKLPTTGTWVGLTHGGGVLVAFNSGTGQITYSLDGFSWNLTDTYVTGNSYEATAYGNGMFVAISKGANRIVYSTGGEFWSTGTMIGADQWSSATYGNQRFIAVNGSNQIFYSVNGKDWFLQGATSCQGLSEVLYGGNCFVALSKTTNRGVRSANGSSWSLITLPAVAEWKLAYGNSRFVAVSLGDAFAIHSTDGSNWNVANLRSSGDWYDIAYGNGKFVAVNATANKVAYSTDGTSWTEVALPTTSSTYWHGIQYIDSGKFVIVGQGDNVLYSTDAINWVVGGKYLVDINGNDVTSSVLTELGHGNC